MTWENLMRDKEVIKRMKANQEVNSFTTIEDHKENFYNNLTVRLINPAKNWKQINKQNKQINIQQKIQSEI